MGLCATRAGLIEIGVSLLQQHPIGGKVNALLNFAAQKAARR